MAPADRELLTVKKAAELLGVSAKTLRRWDAAGRLQAIRDPKTGYRLYRRQDLEAFSGSPTAGESLIGRDELLSQLDPAARLITLLGLPGIGRTRFAQMFCKRQAGFYVDLDFQAPTEALSPRLGVAREALALEIRGRGRWWLVLDHARSAEVGPWAIETLSAAPALSLMIVPERKLGLELEHVVHIPPIAVVAARSLYRRRVEQTGASTAATDAALDPLLEVLGRHPLAIRLAAEQSTTLPPARLLERYPTALDALERPRGEPPERHRSVRATFAAALGFLRKPEQRALAAAAAFESTFDLDAAEAVVAAPREVLDELLSLGWLQVSSERISVPPLLRAYLRATDPVVFSEACHRHTQYFLERPLGDGSDPQILEELLGIASRFPELGPKALLKAPHGLLELGRFEALRTRLDDALPYASTDELPQLLALRCKLLAAMGRVDEARRDAHRAVETAALADDRIRAIVLLQTSWVELNHFGHTAAAVEQLEIARTVACRAADVVLEGRALNGLGSVQLKLGNNNAAADRFRECLALAELAHDDASRAYALGNLAILLLRRGEFVDAAEHCRQAQTIHEARGQPRSAFMMHCNRQRMLLEAGMCDDFDADLAQSLQEARRLGDQGLIAYLELARAWHLYESGDTESAWRTAERARRHATAHDLVHQEAIAAFDRALFSLALGDPEARKSIGGAANLLEGRDDSLALLARAFGAALDGDHGGVRTLQEKLHSAGALREEAAARALDGTARDLACAGCRGRLIARWRIARPEAQLVVTDDGFRFGGRAVSLGQRPTLYRVLRALARAGDGGLTPDELLRRAWPEEQLSIGRSRHRVYGAVRGLRHVGLVCLVNEGGRYRLNAAIRHEPEASNAV
ncbi:MAG: MerR family DNA-binding transcriptional regulator [Myxococcota bacterium]